MRRVMTLREQMEERATQRRPASAGTVDVREQLRERALAQAADQHGDREASLLAPTLVVERPQQRAGELAASLVARGALGAGDAVLWQENVAWIDLALHAS